MSSKLGTLIQSTAVNAAASSNLLRIRISNRDFIARFEWEAAPHTCSAFRQLLPFNMKIIHCRWSGEACWVPLGKWDAPWRPENQTGHPAPGQILLYASGPSEPELLIPYGRCAFNSKFGALTGNHFLTIIENHEQLSEIGHLLLWQGAQDCLIELVNES